MTCFKSGVLSCWELEWVTKRHTSSCQTFPYTPVAGWTVIPRPTGHRAPAACNNNNNNKTRLWVFPAEAHGRTLKQLPCASISQRRTNPRLSTWGRACHLSKAHWWRRSPSPMPACWCATSWSLESPGSPWWSPPPSHLWFLPQSWWRRAAKWGQQGGGGNPVILFTLMQTLHRTESFPLLNLWGAWNRQQDYTYG